MSLLKVNGIVLRYSDYKENDRMLTLFTRENGRVEVIARASRRAKSPLLSATQPFAYGEFVLFKNQDRYSVNSCDIKEMFYNISEDVDRFAAGAYMLSLINDTIQLEEPNEELFSLLYHSLSFLAYSKCNHIDLTICFLVKLLDISGYRPSITACAKCGRDLRQESTMGFISSFGGAVCSSCCPTAVSIEPISLEALRRMLLLSDLEMQKVVLPENVRTKLANLLNDYAETVFEHTFKSFSLLLAGKTKQNDNL